MINGTIKISLKAARVNANMTQTQVADKLSKYFGIRISRQRIMEYEKHPVETPPAFKQGFASIYNIPLEGISFTN